MHTPPRSPDNAPSRYRALVWLAMWLVVFAAMAPAISHALARGQGEAAPGMEICTSMGMRWLPADSAPVGPMSAPDASPLVDCSLCLLLTDKALPAPDAWSLPSLQLLPYTTPIGRSWAWVSGPNRLLPPPRGPPILS